jgi:hypothetical protein
MIEIINSSLEVHLGYPVFDGKKWKIIVAAGPDEYGMVVDFSDSDFKYCSSSDEKTGLFSSLALLTAMKQIEAEYEK